jgi:hypothetical protein
VATQPWLSVFSKALSFFELSSNLVYFGLSYFCVLFMFLLVCQLLIEGCKNEILNLIPI